MKEVVMPLRSLLVIPAVKARCVVIAGLLLTLVSTVATAQTARKPSPSQNPEQQSDRKPDSSVNSLPRINDREEFDSIARVYHPNTPYSLPHAMFVIDRRSDNKVYFVNSQRYRFHKDFLLATYLVPRGADVFKPIYIDEGRRFIVGTIAWQSPVERFTWELWEGDLATADLIRIANRAINDLFFDRVAYKPNSIRQEDVAAGLGIDVILQSDIIKNQEYLALNTGTAVGRIHIIDKLDDTVEIGDNEILVLKELPQSLPPVRGIIVAKPSSPLSHINILAKGWKIPNVYIKDADKLFREFDTFVVSFEARMTDYSIGHASLDDVRDKFVSPDQQVPPADLSERRLVGLSAMRAADSVRFGAKAANQGEIIRARIPGIIVPDGFSIPYYWYDKFMRDNGFDERIEKHLDDLEFIHNPRYRRQKLEELRNDIQKAPFPAALRTAVVQRWRTQLGNRPVFVRSSSNAEDLPNFSGAGLYSSVANVRQAANLTEAIKKVWGSLWKFEAYEARVRNYVDQEKVYMSVLIQLGVDMEKGGVMITADPFDLQRANAVYISAVCGHNSNVVNNAGLPEQLLFDPKSNSVSIMTLSQQESALRFDQSGDLKITNDKCANTQRRVLTDLQARNLARVAIRIRDVFGEEVQDIEWGILAGRIYIVQARPYIDNN
ncbi:MAG TPA: PEP/pyruvate-binding domain-containing protein [Pyrinomonadaceae bacterium]|nr:PEP/pyruvate-binding domain-containing protein [Pyrinomonadaceae bacterium]